MQIVVWSGCQPGILDLTETNYIKLVVGLC